MNYEFIILYFAAGIYYNAGSIHKEIENYAV